MGDSAAKSLPVRVWSKCRSLAPYGGAWTFVAGLGQRLRLAYLHRRFGFPSWHLWPVEWREYALELVQHAQELIDRQGLTSVLEVGCGLGGILGRLRCRRKIGYDTDAKVLTAARRLHPDVDFRQGSFRDVHDQKIDVLVAVNFAHEIPPDPLAEDFAIVLERTRPRYVLVDEVDYAYFHDYEKILPASYRLTWTSREFTSRRRIRCFEATGSPRPPGGDDLQESS